MCYAAYKLWNVCNYEHMHYEELCLPVKYPDWYYQKKAHKDDLWYRQLPSQTAQEICKLLDKSWKSFYALKKSGGIENPKPPRFKNSNIPVTYMQNAVMHETGTDTVRLSLSKQLKAYMAEAYGISETYLFFKNPVFKGTDAIKQIKLYPPEKGECRIIVIYEIPDVQKLSDNGRYMSIDLGLHNLMTCYNSVSSETFIIGRRYLPICSYFNKEISRIQSQWSKQQTVHGETHPRSSKHILSLYRKKADVINDYLHKATRYLVSYCRDNQINIVVIGDISGIRKDNDLGPVTNQKLHSLPYDKLYIMLKYKLAKEGIALIIQEEQYTSQTSPLKPTVDKDNAMKSNRVRRGLYRDGKHTWNADCVGAFNILRKYLCGNGIDITADPMNIKIPFVVKVAV
ncbi:MAG: transposase [Lachnospiraceae bacterium]|nr:transposase [Lachnospiraceae bacterium]